MMNDDGGLPVDLRRACGIGPLWGLASEDLNATLLSWPAGDGVAEHVNDDRDVLVVVIAGAGVVSVDGREQRLQAGHALLIPKGTRRGIRAGANGMRYLSVHRRRGQLQVQPFGQATASKCSP
jgi:quercetin dioxygenase-like cupin family protein